MIRNGIPIRFLSPQPLLLLLLTIPKVNMDGIAIAEEAKKYCQRRVQVAGLDFTVSPWPLWCWNRNMILVDD